MRKFKVVVTDWEYENLQYEEQVLANEQIELVPAQCKTAEEVIAVCSDADALINQYAPISQEVIQALENCKVITRYGVGVNTVDLDAATSKGICVANVPDYCMDEVSDHALALLLSFARKVVLAHEHVKNGVWDFKVAQPILRLRGRVLGLVGFGKIPQALAAKAAPLGLRVIAYDPYVPAGAAERLGVQMVTLDELCTRSDFISVHAPLTSSTYGLIGKQQFDLMKRDSVFLNTARGPVIDENALREALETGRIAGAALDVVAEEPISPDHPFLKMENVILTPHVAWYSEESAAEMRSKAALGVIDVLLHQEYPRYLVNQQVKQVVQLRPSQSEDRYQKWMQKLGLSNAAVPNAALSGSSLDRG